MELAATIAPAPELWRHELSEFEKENLGFFIGGQRDYALGCETRAVTGLEGSFVERGMPLDDV